MNQPRTCLAFALFGVVVACSSSEQTGSGTGGGAGGGGNHAGVSSGGGGTSAGGSTSGGGSFAGGTGGASGSGGSSVCPPTDAGSATAPTPTCVAGTVQNGSAITIVGAGFGATGPNVVLFDDFEKGTVGQPIQVGAGSAEVGAWTGLNTGIPVYGDEYRVSGGQAFKADFTVDSNQQAFAALPADTTEIFYSWWQFVPTGHNYPGEGSVDTLNWKVIWLLGNDSFSGGTADDDVFLAFLGDGAAPSATFGGNCSVYTNGSIWPEIQTHKGEWKRLSIWDRGRTDATGAVKIWELRPSGMIELENQSDMPTLPTDCGGAPHRWESVSFNGYGRLTPAPANAYLDDFYVAVGPAAQARVEIGDAATYGACTKLTFATPTAWSDASITANVWQGQFASGDNAYVYVFDRNGNANSSGFPVTFQ